MTIHLARDMDNLHRHIMEMCRIVEKVVHKAVELLQQPDAEVSQRIAQEDDLIDEWDVRIEEECLKVLALHQPVAIDLRRIATVLKITGELERVADLAVNIAERAAGLLTGPRIRVPDRLERMSQIALGMLHQSIDAYVRMDASLARSVINRDEEVDRLNREIIQELLTVMKSSPDLIDPALHLFSASRHVERVADHATNIAEDVIYLVEGAIVRHKPQLLAKSFR
jgi:phosphate transport system protein